MSTPSNAMGEFGVPSGIAPATTPATRPMYWSLRRELWENRSIYIAPLVVTAVVLFASLVSTIGLPRRIRTLPALGPERQHALIVTPFSMAPAPIMLAAFLVGIFYCLDALHGERRDRSILFWKSLPVSDRTTVLSKAVIPLAVLPVIGFVLSMATVIVLLMASTAVLVGNGMSPAALWNELRLVQQPMVMFYGLAVHTLWFAPIYCWLLLVSAWARRAAFLWALLPLVATAALERIAFGTSYFASMLKYRVTGAMVEAFASKRQPGSTEILDRLSQLAPGRFLTTSGLWLGLAFAAGCLAAAVRLRRYQEPI